MLPEAGDEELLSPPAAPHLEARLIFPSPPNGLAGSVILYVPMDTNVRQWLREGRPRKTAFAPKIRPARVDLNERGQQRTKADEMRRPAVRPAMRIIVVGQDGCRQREGPG
jgi:hypothetical protein